MAFWGERVVGNHQKKGYGVEKSKDGRIPSESEKCQLLFTKEHPTPFILNLFSVSLLRRAVSDGRASHSSPDLTLPSPCPITYDLLLALALRLFLKPAQLPGLGRTLIPVSSPRAGSSLLSQQKQFREGSEKCQSQWGMQLKEGEGRSEVPSLFLPSNY